MREVKNDQTASDEMVYVACIKHMDTCSRTPKPRHTQAHRCAEEHLKVMGIVFLPQKMWLAVAILNPPTNQMQISKMNLVNPLDLIFICIL